MWVSVEGGEKGGIIQTGVEKSPGPEKYVIKVPSGNDRGRGKCG